MSIRQSYLASDLVSAKDFLNDFTDAHGESKYLTILVWNLHFITAVFFLLNKNVIFIL